jgi:peptidoglycan/xylan/chitin deacetylase (PgdA/CDA1 family)
MRRLASIALPALGLGLLLVAGFAKTGEERFGDVNWWVKTEKKIVALTIDDGPDPEYTPTVLRIAREKHVKLTFFLVGMEVQRHPELVREEVAQGHEIGNHTWRHHKLGELTEAEDIADLKRCDAEIARVCGRHTNLFRPAYGIWNGDTFLAAHQLKYRMILWTLTLRPRGAKTPKEMAGYVLKHIQPGMIILAHDGQPRHPVNLKPTMAALPYLIDGLEERGYKLVTVSELLAEGAARP